MLARALLTGVKREGNWKASKFFCYEKPPQYFGINFMHGEQMYLAHSPKTPCLGIWPSADRWPQSLGALHLWPPTAHPDTMNQKLKYSFRDQHLLETRIHNQKGEKFVSLLSTYFLLFFYNGNLNMIRSEDLWYSVQTQWQDKFSIDILLWNHFWLSLVKWKLLV